MGDDENNSAELAEFEPMSKVRAHLGESPVWSTAHNAVWWVDITGRKVLRTKYDGSTEFWSTPEIPGFVQCLGNDVLVGMQSGIFRFDPSSVRFERIVGLDVAGQRFNDSCVDDQGRIWAGTMDLENTHANGVLYLFDPLGRQLSAKIGGLRTVNGLAWDSSRSRLYVSDSHPSVQTVWACDIGPETAIGRRREFARFDKLAGRPDGAALDGPGNYWIAGVGGGELYRFSPDGDLIARYRVGPNSPTKPAFIPPPTPAMVLTSFEDDANGGRLHIWRAPPSCSI